MEYYKNILAVEARWLCDNSVMTESMYRHGVERKTFNVIRHGCMNTPALVEYESLPDRFKCLVLK
ncbi:MAG: hypothetical protein MJ204_00005 [Bacteroidales bacterium]|nr:hypothetical protein [Bacteroidales bacterium]